MQSRTILQTVAAYFAALRANDSDAWVDAFAEDAVSYDPVGSPPIQGHEALRRLLQAASGQFERTSLTEDHVFVAGNGAAVKWTSQGVDRDGREVTLEGIDVFEINEEGKIQTLWAYWDPTAFTAEPPAQGAHGLGLT
jgi:steroid delta-isomerase